MTFSKILWGNILATGLSRGATVLLGLATPIIVARRLGPATFGYYVSLFSLLTLADFTLEAALLRITVREISEAPKETDSWVSAATLLRLGAGMLGVGGTFLFMRLAGYPAEVRTAGLVGSFLLLINAFRTPVAVFRANLQMQWELAVTLISRIVEPALVLWFALTGRGLVYFFLARVISCVCYAAVAWWVAHSRFGLRFHLDRAAIRRIATKATPLGIESLLVMIQLKGDILLVSLLAGPVSGGLYGVVAQLAEFSLLAPDIVLSPVFPVLTRSYVNAAHQNFQQLYQRTFDLFMIFVIPSAVAVTLFPELAIRLLFGPKYLPAAPVLRVLVWVIVLMYSAGLTGTAAIAINRQKALARVQVANVLVYLAINLTLIPRWNYWAAVLARLVAVLMGSFLSYRIVRRAAGYSLHSQTLQLVLISGAAMAVAVLLLSHLGAAAALVAGTLVYSALFWLLHSLRAHVAGERP